MKLKTKKERETHNKYNTPSCSILDSVKVNAIFVRQNTKEHEQMKFELAWECIELSETFITEAERPSTLEEQKLFGKKRVVDFVNLSTGEEIEIVHKHESDMQIKLYREQGVIVIIIGKKTVCHRCKETYPKRNDKDPQLCQNCSGRQTK